MRKYHALAYIYLGYIIVACHRKRENNDNVLILDINGKETHNAGVRKENSYKINLKPPPPLENYKCKE